MTLAVFGPFAEVFAKGELDVPGHLELLTLREDTAQVVFDRIETAIAAGDTSRWLAALFGDANWRPHLVGAIALIFGAGAPDDPGLLWGAADGGSWVIPQLVVAASFADADFPARVRRRVERLCPIQLPVGLSPVQRHSATGPGSSRSRSAKLLGSLLGVGEGVVSLAPWIAEVRTDPRVTEWLAEDVDDGAGIARHWRERLVMQMARRGHRLEPKAS